MESAGQHHPGFGIGQLRDQARRPRSRIDQRQRGRQLVLTCFTGPPWGGFCRVGPRDQLAGLSIGRTTERVRRDRAGHHRPAGQRGVQGLPGQVVAHVQAVQPIGRAIPPGAESEQHQQQQDQGGDERKRPRHQLATCTLFPVTATVS